MKAVSGRRFCLLLESRGWQLRRIRGSHFIYAKEGHVSRISVPVHGAVALKRGLQAHLMIIADIDESELKIVTCRQRISMPRCISGLVSRVQGRKCGGDMASTWAVRSLVCMPRRRVPRKSTCKPYSCQRRQQRSSGLTARVPDRRRITVYRDAAKHVGHLRQLALADTGSIYAASRKTPCIYTV